MPFMHIIEAVFLAASLIGLVILANIFQQILFKNSNEPPVVFHYLPVFGSAVAYGMDPFKFFSDCQKKVFYLHLPLRLSVPGAANVTL